MMMNRFVAILFSLLVTSPLLAQDGPPPANVRVALASFESMAPITLVPGTVVSRNDARLAAEVEGRLLMVADVGTVVAMDDPVARIEDTTLRLRNAELQAEITRAEARVRFLVAEEKRFQALADSNLAAATQLEQTRSDRDVAQGDLEIARVRLLQNEDLIERAVIKAPFAGIVVARLMMPGERVSDGQEVARVVDPDHLEVVARAPLEYYEFVGPGTVLDVQGANEETQAKVRTVVAVGDENTHQFELRLDLVGSSLPVGKTMRVAIPMSDEREVLAVPRDALVLRPGATTVFVVDDGDQARQVSVTTGIGSGDRVEVLGALSPGDRVVIRGNERLQSGQAVNIMESQG